MRKIFAFLFAFATLYVSSQTTCQTAAPFCAGGTSGITFPATTVQASPPPNAPTGPFYGCLGTTPNAAWYFMQIANPGPLDVLIQGQLANGNAGQDVDFICWGPFSSLTNVCNGLVATNTVDCSYSSSFTETLNIPNGVTGQYYMVLITNFANVTQNIIFNQIGGAGNTDCTILQANSPTICAGSTATITATNSSNLSTPNYSINPNIAAPNSTGSFVVAPSITTNFTIYITGLNNVGAIITETALSTVFVNPQPLAAPTITQTSCTNTTSAVDLHLTFNPATPPPSYTVSWSSIPPSVTSNTTTTATAVGASPYTTTIIAAGGCSVVSNFTVTQQPAQATFTLIPLSTVFSVTCSQPTVIIDASNSSFSYTWTNGSAAPINDTEGAFTSATLGTWTITGQNPASGCVASHTFIVGINTLVPTAAITPTFQNVTCLIPAQTVSASATPTSNVTHLFISPGGSTITANSYTAVYIPGPPGTYTHYIVNNLNGCKSNRTFTLASSDNFPLLNVSSSHNFTLGCGPTNSICPITLSGSTTPQNGGSISYTLLPPPGTATNYGFSSTSTQYTVNIPGSWLAIVRDDNNNCQTKVPFSVVQDIAGPDIDDIVDTPILSCYTHSTLLTAVTSNTNVTFAWSFPGPSGSLTVINPTVIANTTTNTASALAANYTLSITDNHNGCTSTKLVPIQQNLFPPKPGISSGNTFTLTCTTPTVLLTNSSTHNTGMTNAGFPTNSIVAAFWSGPSPQPAIQFAAQYLASTPGTYTLVAQDLNNGCTSQTTTVIGDNRIYPVVTPNVSTPIDCGSLQTNTGVVSVAVQGSTANLSFVWTKIGPSLGTFSNQGKASQIVSEPGDYRVIITNTLNGCQISSGASIANGTLSADFTADQTSGYAPLTVNFTNNSSSVNSNSIISVWSFGNGTQTTTPSASLPASAYYSQAGTYTVILFATKGSCHDNDTLTITVDIPGRLEVPNVFTPNGDGVNDFFFLKAANLNEITARIYDRWGHKVYELTSTTGNISWDGNSETGKEVAPGTYFYVIKATGKDGHSFDTKGTVNLYR